MMDRGHGGLTCAEVDDLAPAFVLGALEADRMAAVREHIALCPEPHAELARLGGVVPYLAESVPSAEPDPALRARILAAAGALPAPLAGPVEADRTPPAMPPVAPVMPADPSVPVAIADRRPARRWSPVSIGLAAAAAIVIVVLGAWNLSLQSRLDGLVAYREGVVAVLDAAAEPGSQVAVLSPAADADGRGIAAVRADGVIVLAMRDLAPTAGTQVYETWLIAGEDDPVPLGGFGVGSDGVATFTTDAGPPSSGAVVALTLEPAPGATSPSGAPVSAGVAQTPPA
jgi:anti-sigma-K factor RskA